MRAAAGTRVIRHPMLPGESVSSFLIRTARGNAFSLHELVSRLLGKSVHHDSSVDLDVGVPKRLLEALQSHRLATADVLERASLRHLVAPTAGCTEPTMPPRWVVHSATSGGRAWASPYCPTCWANDPVPYVRGTWRLSWWVACPDHGEPLLDRCPVCAEPHSLQPSTRQVQWANLRMSTCIRCFADLGLAKTPQAHARGLQLQVAADRAVQTGWAQLGTTHIAAPLYFHGLAVLLRMLRTRPVGRRMRHHVDLVECEDLSRPFDRLALSDRAHLLGVAAALLDDWPHAFHRIGRHVRLRSADLTDLGYALPYWLQHATQRFDRTWYRPSAIERASARNVLQRHSGIDAASIVREWLGSFASKPSIRSRMLPLDDPVQLGLAWERPGHDAWLRQSLVDRLCQTLSRYVRRRAEPARRARPSVRPALPLL